MAFELIQLQPLPFGCQIGPKGLRRIQQIQMHLDMLSQCLQKTQE